MHEPQRREKSMSKQLSVNTSICSEHPGLLEESQGALKIWNEYRPEFCQFRFIRREAGDELLRLQAKYARAYTLLSNHEYNCSLCQLVSRIEGRDSENSSDTLSDYELCT
jgi:hypothetical protein